MLGVEHEGSISLGLWILLGLWGCSGAPSPGGSCESTRDCVSGEVCVGGTCTPADRKLGCNGDTDCMLGQWCDLSDHQCKQIVGEDSGVPPAKDTGVTDTGTSTTSGCTRDDQCGAP